MKSKKVYVSDPSSVFTTYDLGCSTALLCADFELLTIEKTDPKKALFVFRKQDGIEETANKYYANSLEVKARSYFDYLKALKNRLYSR
ncbi:MAG: DUF5659 domain-containing protein [bacterium]